MGDGIDSTIDALKDFLNSPDAEKTISSMLGTLLPGTPETSEKSTSPALQPEKLMQIMEACKSMDTNADNRVTLLRAVRPFLRESRRTSVDTAIQLLTVMRIMPLLGNINDLI